MSQRIALKYRAAQVTWHRLLSLNIEYQITLSLTCTNKTVYYILCRYDHNLHTYMYVCMYVCIYIYIHTHTYFPHGSTTLLGLGLLMEHTSGRVISPSQRPLPYNTQRSQDTSTHAPGGIQTLNTSKRLAADPGLRPRGHRDWPIRYHYTNTHLSTC